jgi:hypothetical protein
MTELTLALGVLALFVTIVTLAVVRSQLTANTQKSDRIVVAALDRLTARVATESFPQLLDGTFARPEAENCVDPADSCPEVLGRTVNVRWSVTAGGDGDDIVDTVDWVDLRAEADWNGVTFSSQRRISSPTPNWRQGWGTLRVNVSGSAVTSEGVDLYLVDSTTGRPASGAGQVVDGVAWISASLDSCGAGGDGCSLALGPYGATSVGEVALDAVSALTTIFLHQDRLVETSTLLRAVGEASLSLYATNGGGEIATASRTGSVCIWASFHDGVDSREVPFCNSEQPDTIVLDTYQPDPTRTWVQLPVPTAWPITLTVDDPSGDCSAPSGSVRWDGNSWVDGGTCTSWTWGSPETITGDGTTGGFDGSTIRFGSGVNRYELNWTVGDGTPAAGGPSLQPLWSHPRDADLIALGTECPGATLHCRSGARVAPVLTAPRVGDAKVAAVNVSGGSGDFTVQATDYGYLSGDGPTTINVTGLELGGGTLARLDTVLVDGNQVIVETPLGIGDSVVVGTTGSASANLRLTGVTSGYRSITFSIVGDGASRSTTVAVTDSARPVTIFGEPARVAQGDSSTLRVRVFDSTGAAAATVTVTPSSVPSGMTVTAAVTDSQGWATLPVAVSTATAGNRTFTLTADGVSAVGRVRVAARAGSVTLAPAVPNPVVVDQGGTATFEFTLRDLAGDIMASTAVAVWATRSGVERDGDGDVYSSARGCETDASGRCEVTVRATAQAPVDDYLLNVAVHSLSATLPLRVDPTPLRASAPLVTVSQDESADLVVTVLDGSGQPVSGVVVTPSSPVATLTVTSGTTNGSGVATLSVTAAATAPAGLQTVALSAGGATGTATVRVRQKVTALSVVPLVVPQGGVLVSEVTARDAAGATVPGTVISAVSTDGLVLRAGPAGSDGIVRLSVEAPLDLVPTAYLVSLSVGGQLIEMLPVRVVLGVGSVTASGTLTPGQTSEITIRLYDLDGANIPSRSLTVATTNSALQVGTTVAVQPPNNTPVAYTTNTSGSVNVPVFLSANALAEPIGLRVVTGGRTFTVFVQVTP